MLYDIEPEIADGQRAVSMAQSLFSGEPRTLAIANPVICSWYGSTINPLRGSFCYVLEGSSYESLVGEFLRFRGKQLRSVICYCLGATPDIPTPISISRRAWLELDTLPIETLSLYVEAVLP